MRHLARLSLRKFGLLLELLSLGLGARELRQHLLRRRARPVARGCPIRGRDPARAARRAELLLYPRNLAAGGGESARFGDAWEEREEGADIKEVHSTIKTFLSD